MGEGTGCPELMSGGRSPRCSVTATSLQYGEPPDREREEPRSRNKRGVVLLALVTGLLTVVLVVIVVIAGTRDDPKTVTGKAAHKAGRNLRKVPGLALSGTYGGGPATFTVTRAGTARGTYTFSGDQVNRIDVGSTTYL
ncbi:MAG: hypothetical protein JWP48_3773 [Actinoallomurus sp.]|jgi:hypothetical protein|nr:hypothetical protein [Actinoallomurus sp.]